MQICNLLASNHLAKTSAMPQKIIVTLKLGVYRLADAWVALLTSSWLPYSFLKACPGQKREVRQGGNPETRVIAALWGWCGTCLAHQGSSVLCTIFCTKYKLKCYTESPHWRGVSESQPFLFWRLGHEVTLQTHSGHTDSDTGTRFVANKKSYQVQFSLGGSLEGRMTVNSTRGKLRMHKRYTCAAYSQLMWTPDSHQYTTWQLHAQITRLGLERELVITEKRKKECVRKSVTEAGRVVWIFGLTIEEEHWVCSAGFKERQTEISCNKSPIKSPSKLGLG